MNIYHPKSNEINHVINVGITKHPPLTARYQRAGKLLKNRALHLNNGWRCDSQSHADETYDLDSGGCNCFDFLSGGASANNRIFCKHLLAFFAYREILISHLNQRLAGNLRFSNERRRAEQWPGTLLILDTDSRPRLLSYVDGHRFPRAICHVRLDKRERQTPITDQDLAHFARWLVDARPMPQADSMALLDDDALVGARAQVVAQATGIEQIEAFDTQVHTATNGANGNGHLFPTHADYQHWLNTGELPAVRQSW